MSNDGSRRVSRTRRVALLALAVSSLVLGVAVLFTAPVEQRVARASTLELSVLAGLLVAPWLTIGLCVLERRLPARLAPLR